MLKNKHVVVAINSGSSSIKFAIYDSELLHCWVKGRVDKIGTKNPQFSVIDNLSEKNTIVAITSINQKEICDQLLNWINIWIKQNSYVVHAIGHRIVHGMNHTHPLRITLSFIKELKQISEYDPEHLFLAITLIEKFAKYNPDITQIACFDSSFHSSMPSLATMLPIPRRYFAKGIRRYGFHGLSYTYLMDKIAEIYKQELPAKIILAHLGSGASMVAVHNGKSIDTSMSFTPTGGFPMSTRTGDLDSSVALYMLQKEKLSLEQFSHMINHESGMLGISETSADIKELLEQEKYDVRSADAVNLFCYQIKKWVGAYAAALGGINALVFTAGIGENSSIIRARICDGLSFLGIELDEKRNRENKSLISLDIAKVKVYVIPTYEEFIIAKIFSGMC